AHQPFRKALSAVRSKDKNVADKSERRKIRDDPRESDLLGILVHAETQRVLDGSLEYGAGNSGCPVRLRMEKTVYRFHVDPCSIGADDKIPLAPFHIRSRMP